MKELKYAILAIFLALSLYSLYKTVFDIYQKNNRLSDLKKDIENLEAENRDLKKEFEYKSSKEFIKREAGEKLFMGLPGEKIIIVPKDFLANLPIPNKSGETYNKTEEPIWKRWVSLISSGFSSPL